MSLSPATTVRLLDVDPDLGARLPAGIHAEALRLARGETLPLEQGEVDVAALGRERPSLHALLLLDGLLARGVAIGETTSLELLGPGDLVELGSDPLRGRLVTIELRWVVLESLTAVVVDDDLLHGLLRWPALAAALFERAGAQATRLAARCAISQLSRVEDRIETLMWYLAERFGRIAPDGIVLPLRLTHVTLGQMIGAKRPTVSIALKTLEAAETVRRRSDGGWLLRVPDDAPVRLSERPGGGIRRVDAGERATLGERAATSAAALRAARDEERRDAVARWQQTRVREQVAANEMLVRLDRLRHMHHVTRLRVSSSLQTSATTRADSAALRQRIRRERAGAADGG